MNEDSSSQGNIIGPQFLQAVYQFKVAVSRDHLRPSRYNLQQKGVYYHHCLLFSLGCLSLSDTIDSCLCLSDTMDSCLSLSDTIDSCLSLSDTMDSCLSIASLLILSSSSSQSAFSVLLSFIRNTPFLIQKKYKVVQGYPQNQTMRNSSPEWQYWEQVDNDSLCMQAQQLQVVMMREIKRLGVILYLSTYYLQRVLRVVSVRMRQAAAQQERIRNNSQTRLMNVNQKKVQFHPFSTYTKVPTLPQCQNSYCKLRVVPTLMPIHSSTTYTTTMTSCSETQKNHSLKLDCFCWLSLSKRFVSLLIASRRTLSQPMSSRQVRQVSQLLRRRLTESSRVRNSSFSYCQLRWQFLKMKKQVRGPKRSAPPTCSYMGQFDYTYQLIIIWTAPSSSTGTVR